MHKLAKASLHQQLNWRKDKAVTMAKETEKDKDNLGKKLAELKELLDDIKEIELSLKALGEK